MTVATYLRIVIFMAACMHVSCLVSAIADVVFVQINIGIIVDSHASRFPDNVTSLPCNITLEWYHADFRELFHVYRTVSKLDQTRDDLDLLVLLDYDTHDAHGTELLKTRNKRLIYLNGRSSVQNQTSLEDLVLQFAGSNSNITDDGLYQGQPYCRLWQNVSIVEETPRLLGDTIATTPPLILAHLVELERWKVVTVLHDSYSEHEARVFLDHVSHHGTVFTVYNVDTVGNLHGKLLALYDEAMRVERTIDVVVICRLDHLISVLHMASKYDSSNKEDPTLLKQFSRWLLVVYDYNNRAASLIQTVARDLDNVVIVAVPELRPPSKETIVSRLHDFSYELYAYTELTNETEDKSYYLQSITKEILLIEPTSMCSDYTIDSLIWKKSGREFLTVGHGDLEGHVTLTSDPFPNTKYGYSGRHFRITTKVYEPYVTTWTNKDNELEFGGVYIDLVAELSRVLNFTYTLSLVPDNMFGGVYKVENGTKLFNGMVGMVQRKEADFAAAPLTIIPIRDEVVDFSYPVSHEYTTVIVKKPDPDAFKWRFLLNPLKLEVLLYIGLSLIIATVLIYAMERFGPFYSMPENARSRMETGSLHHLHNAFWFMYGALLHQGGIRLPDSFAGRTLISGWWIFCIVIVGTYCGNLIAFLTVTKVIMPFNTLDEMYALRGQYKWGTQGGSVWETIFTTSSNPSFSQIGNAMKDFNNSDPNIFHHSEQFHKDRVKDGGYGWIVDATTTELLMSSACDLTTIKEKVLPMKDAFVFQHNSPHTVVFSKQIMKAHEAGLFEIWRRKWWPKTNFCANANKLEAKPISLMEVQSAFYVCLVGVFFGTVAFALEIAMFKWRIRGKRKPSGVHVVTNQAHPAESDRRASS